MTGESRLEMDHAERRYQYSVVRDVGGPRYADVALVRASAPHGVLERLLRQERRDAIVLAHRTFRPMFELTEMEAYAAQLERAAEHGNDGTLGCFLDIDQRDDGMVRVALYERWFDGRRLRCERLAVRDFDATEPGDRAERATERDDAARQLAEILAAHNTPADIE